MMKTPLVLLVGSVLALSACGSERRSSKSALKAAGDRTEHTIMNCTTTVIRQNTTPTDWSIFESKFYSEEDITTKYSSGDNVQTYTGSTISKDANGNIDGPKLSYSGVVTKTKLNATDTQIDIDETAEDTDESGKIITVEYKSTKVERTNPDGSKTILSSVTNGEAQRLYTKTVTVVNKTTNVIEKDYVLNEKDKTETFKTLSRTSRCVEVNEIIK